MQTASNTLNSMRSADSFLFRSLVRAHVETGQFCLRNSPLKEGILIESICWKTRLSLNIP